MNSLLFLVLCLFVSFYSLSQVSSFSYVGVAVIKPTTNPQGLANNAHGTVVFTYTNSTGLVQVTVNVQGNFADGDYGIHVHQFGDLTNNVTGDSASSHYVGQGTATHGCPPSTVRHEGDMGNWTASGGVISQTKTLDLLTLTGGFSIIGRAVVIHSKFDDCVTANTGNSGNRTAFGVIGLQSSSDNVASTSANVTVAVAVLTPTNATGVPCSNCGGTFYFTQLFDGSGNPAGVSISGSISGITDGLPHGLHVHMFGDLSNPSGSTAGSHWNPDNHTHNVPPYERHRGDLGNIQSYDSNGVAYYNYPNNTYIGVLSAFVGRSLVLHSSFDHGNGTGCDQTGNSGTRMSWGVIGITNSSFVAPSTPVSVDNTFAIQPCISQSTSPSVSYTPTLSSSASGTLSPSASYTYSPSASYTYSPSASYTRTQSVTISPTCSPSPCGSDQNSGTKINFNFANMLRGVY